MNLRLMERDEICAALVAREIRHNPQSRFKVLIADDAEFDRILVSLSFLESEGFTIVGEVADGEQAMHYLAGHQPFADRALYPFPDLLLLDLHMPRMSGLEVLAWIHEQHFNDLAVVVLSSSLSPAMVAKVVELGADCYEEKTGHTAKMKEFVRRLEMLMVCRHKCPRLEVFPIQQPRPPFPRHPM